MRKRLFFTSVLCLVSQVSHAAFTKAQVGVSSSSAHCTFGSAIGTGHLVVLGVEFYDATSNCPTITSIIDNSSNTYLVSANSPSSVNASGAGCGFLIYSANTIATVTRPTITLSFSKVASVADVFCDDFAVTGGQVYVDDDRTGSGNSGTTINTPTVVVSGPGELLYALGLPGVGNITSAGAPWTINEGGVKDGNVTEWILSISSNTAVSF